MFRSKDSSPVIPSVGLISESTLLQRRVDSNKKNSGQYYKYDEYDNISLISLNARTVEKVDNSKNMVSYTQANR